LARQAKREVFSVTDRLDQADGCGRSGSRWAHPVARERRLAEDCRRAQPESRGGDLMIEMIE